MQLGRFAMHCLGLISAYAGTPISQQLSLLSAIFAKAQINLDFPRLVGEMEAITAGQAIT